jgi:hypothetical protein
MTSHDNCAGYTQKNPITNDFTCGASKGSDGTPTVPGKSTRVMLSQTVSKVTMQAFCGGVDPWHYDCNHWNVMNVAAASNEIFLEEFHKCTGNDFQPDLPSAGCGQKCHHVWFHQDCQNDCGSAMTYGFNFIDVVWGQRNAPYIQCYKKAGAVARDYFNANVWFVDVGHTIETHFCDADSASVGLNIVSIDGKKCDFTQMTLFNTFADNNKMELCVTGELVEKIKFGSITSCNTGLKDCPIGYMQRYFTFNGMCEVLLCIIEQVKFSDIRLKKLPFMEYPNDNATIHYPY